MRRAEKRRLIRLYLQSQKVRKKLSPQQIAQTEKYIEQIRDAKRRGEREKISLLLNQWDLYAQSFPKLSWVRKGMGYFFSLSLALAVAICFRHSYGELYEIPSGSMRPTLREGDRLFVSKLSFGLNVPLTPRHFWFRPQDVQRTSLVVFTTEKMGISGSKTRYFGFPGYKRFVKRCMGKGGDRLYFYGGKIYAIDEEGRELVELREAPWVCNREYLPSPIMNEGEPLASWGVHNYAFARLLWPQEAETFYPERVREWDVQAKAYLELHTLSAPGPKALPQFSLSLLPLRENHLERIWDSLSTSRFVVRDHLARSYGEESFSASSPYLELPDGSYEWIEGEAYTLLWGSRAKQWSRQELRAVHSLAFLQKLFNTGVHFLREAIPERERNQKGLFQTRRFAYFLQGDLYLLGKPLFFSTDPILQNYLTLEERREERENRHVAFRDENLLAMDPMDRKKLIEERGLLIPKGTYYCVGDNWSNSRDSRSFGPIPENNLRGTPFFFFWPPGRWGKIQQPHSSWALYSASLLLLFLLLFVLLSFLYSRYKKRKLLLKLS